MLIRDAELDGRKRVDLRIEHQRVASMGALSLRPNESLIEARGCALFPGLHDHHIHLAAYAASLVSVPCGPPDIRTAEEFAKQLSNHDEQSVGWLRGTGYHESVAGSIDRCSLDRIAPRRPVRIQHRSGRLWMFNSAGLALLDPAPGDPLERHNGHPTGRLYDADDWLRTRLRSRFPSLADASCRLAGWGVTAVTDATASNGLKELDYISQAQYDGALLQSVLVMGDDHLTGVVNERIGPRKFHLHDGEFPDFDATVAAIRRSHAAQRATAFHCVTRTDLTFALAALQAASAGPGDRIEHAAVAPPELVLQMQALGVTVVTQPNFIFERGERYLAEEPAENQPWLYRAKGLVGIPLAAGTDAPFGEANPWALMDAAVTRKTREGQVIGADERLTPEEALGLFLGTSNDPGGARRRVIVGAPADLVLLDRCWADARRDLAAVRVKATWKAGAVIFND
jgi:predicted amidohydrolase YtcJ